MTSTTLHELKIKRNCPLLKSRANLIEVISAMPWDTEIAGFRDDGIGTDDKDDQEIKILFRAESLGPQPKTFRVERGIFLKESLTVK